jgi:hypothetical protein
LFKQWKATRFCRCAKEEQSQKGVNLIKSDKNEYTLRCFGITSNTRLFPEKNGQRTSKTFFLLLFENVLQQSMMEKVCAKELRFFFVVSFKTN